MPSDSRFTLHIERLVEGGKGLGFHEGRPVFVPFVLPGESVQVQITRRHKQYWEAQLAGVLNAVPERITPPCPYFQKCGGCQWQHIAYETQLHWKQKIMEETLRRIGKIENPNVLPTIPSPKIWNWRSRVTLHQDENGRIGFFEAESHKVVDIENCRIAEETINKELRKLREESQSRRRDFELRSGPEMGFTQVNPLQNENLKRLVKNWTEKIPHDHIVELFCGSGNFTEVLAPLAKKIVAVDSDRAAIDQAQQRFSRLLHFECTDAVRFFAQYEPDNRGVSGVRAEFTSAERIDLLVLDPPRDGAAGIVEGVLKNQPVHIIYISCNPATLARDLKYLKDFAGYQLVQSQPVDMFPMSYHIESVNSLAPA